MTFFRQAISTSKIKVDLVESFSTAICRYFDKNKLVFLIYQDLLVLLFNRTPIFCQVLSKKISQNDIDKFLSLSQERFKTLPQEVFFSPPGDVAFNQFDFKGIVPNYIDIDPIKGIINSPNVSGSDSSTSRLEVKINHSSPPKILLIIPILTLLTILFVIFSDRLLPVKNSDLQINPVISTTPTLTPTPTSIDLSQFKVSVLNGTGIAGQAGQIVELITPVGFTVDKTGNAANYDFSATTIQTKKTVPSEVIQKLQQAIKTDFPSQLSTQPLPDTSDYDIIVTTGK